MEGYLSTTHAAEYAGVSRTQIYRWFDQGLKSHSRGNRTTRFVRIKDIDEWIVGKQGRPHTRNNYLLERRHK